MPAKAKPVKPSKPAKPAKPSGTKKNDGAPFSVFTGANILRNRKNQIDSAVGGDLKKKQ